MAKALVKCKYCGVQFDRNAEPFVEAGGRRYAHKACAEEYEASLTQEQRDENNFYQYVKELFGNDYNYMMTKKLVEKYTKEFAYTFSGMQKALYWFYELKKNPLDKANGSIGIVPYIYNDARDYYYRLYLAQVANNIEEVKEYKPAIVEIEIESPRARVEPPRLFNIGDE